jgi:hypothetical protein
MTFDCNYKKTNTSNQTEISLGTALLNQTSRWAYRHLGLYSKVINISNTFLNKAKNQDLDD